MSPNVPTEVNSIVNSKESKGDIKEILYNGYLYDVTTFFRKHPGGNVIKFYTEPGEDASQAIDQFHFRSKNKVELIMKSFPKRPVPSIESSQKELSAKHQELSNDFQTLFLELQKEGYFEPSYAHVFLRFLEPVTQLLIFLPLFATSGSVFVKFLLSIPIGFALSRFGWIMHEGGHRSLTGNRRIDGYLQNVAMCFFLGSSSVWWNSTHNRHHAMPQRVQRDADIQTLPFITWTEKEVKPGKSFNKFFVKYQGILYWTVDLLLFVVASRFFLHPQAQLRKRAYGELFLTIPNLFIFIVYFGFWWVLLCYYWMSLFLAVSFALNHSHLEVTEEKRHWVEFGLTHTANIKSSLLCDWWMGYLNFQIEHHFFPTIPQFRLKEITPRVKALADKHGIPYQVYGYGEALKLALATLQDVGHSVTAA